MDKQTKQLVILGALVLVAGIVALWQFDVFGGDDEGGKKAAEDTADKGGAAKGGNKGPQNASGQPTPSPKGGNNGAAGAGAAKGGQAPLQDVDLPIPPKVSPTPLELSWPFERNMQDPPYDPLYVQNMDVVDPDRKEYIEELKQEWVLKGLTITKQKVEIRDKDGKHVLGEPVMVPKPLTRKELARNEDGEIIYDKYGRVVLEEKIVYETETNEDGEEVIKMVPEFDQLGRPVLDENGNQKMIKQPKYEQKKDEDGKPVFKDGKPVWVMIPKRDDRGYRIPKLVKAYQDVPVEKDGEPVRDEEGNIKTTREPVYEMRRDAEGNIIRDQNGDPVPVMVQKTDEDGNPVTDSNGDPIMEPKQKWVPDETPQYEVRWVKEVWFDGKTRTYRENDRLTGTRFTIKKIFENRKIVSEGGSVKVRSGVDLLGDTGAEVTLYLADDSRYGDKIMSGELKGK